MDYIFRMKGRPTSHIAELVRHPVAFLLFANVLCALLAAAQFGVALALLNAVDFAAIGVLGAITGIVTQVLDPGGMHLTTKLFSQRASSALVRRSDDLVAGLALQVGLAVAIAVVATIGGILLGPLFLQQPITWWWVVSIAIGSGARYVFTPVVGYLRLIGNFKASGLVNLGAAVVSFAITLALLMVSPNLDGYFAAIGVSNLLVLAIALGVADSIVSNAFGRRLLRMPPAWALRDLMRSRRFLVANSVASFSKVLARCDILLVVTFAGETVAGTYRVARQAYEALIGLGDAVHQFYNPTAVAAVSAGDTARFRSLSVQLIAIGGIAAVGAVAGTLLVLGPLAEAYLPAHAPSIASAAILSGLIGVNIGIHGWLWPLLVAEGRIGRYSLLSIAGAIVQMVAIACLGLAGHLSAAAAAATNWLPALITYVPYLRRAGRR